MTDIELKPCPFCGATNIEINQIGNENTPKRGFEVKCVSFGCATKKRAMVIRQPLAIAREYAVNAWNNRARIGSAPTDDAALVKGEAKALNDRLDPFEEIGQALYEEGYRNGFADANYDGGTYDLDLQLAGLDGELIRDGWYEGNKHDFLSKVEAALAARGAGQGEAS